MTLKKAGQSIAVILISAVIFVNFPCLNLQMEASAEPSMKTEKQIQGAESIETRSRTCKNSLANENLPA